MFSVWSILAGESALLVLILAALKPWRTRWRSVFLMASILGFFFLFGILGTTFGNHVTAISFYSVIASIVFIPLLLFAVFRYTDNEMPVTDWTTVGHEVGGVMGMALAITLLSTWIPCGRHASSSCWSDHNHLINLAYRQFTQAAPFSSWTWDAMFLWAMVGIIFIGFGIYLNQLEKTKKIAVEDLRRYKLILAITLALLTAGTIYTWIKSMDEPPMFHEDAVNFQPKPVQQAQPPTSQFQLQLK